MFPPNVRASDRCPLCGHLGSDHIGGLCARLLLRRGHRLFTCPCGRAKPGGKIWPLYAKTALAHGADPDTLPPDQSAHARA